MEDIVVVVVDVDRNVLDLVDVVAVHLYPVNACSFESLPKSS